MTDKALYSCTIFLSFLLFWIFVPQIHNIRYDLEEQLKSFSEKSDKYDREIKNLLATHYHQRHKNDKVLWEKDLRELGLVGEVEK